MLRRLRENEIFPLSVSAPLAEVFGRGDRIRTYDPLFPKQMRYQAALRPEPGVCVVCPPALGNNKQQPKTKEAPAFPSGPRFHALRQAYFSATSEIA